MNSTSTVAIFTKAHPRILMVALALIFLLAATTNTLFLQHNKTAHAAPAANLIQLYGYSDIAKVHSMEEISYNQGYCVNMGPRTGGNFGHVRGGVYSTMKAFNHSNCTGNVLNSMTVYLPPNAKVCQYELFARGGDRFPCNY